MQANLVLQSLSFEDTDAYFSKEELAMVLMQWGSMVVNSKFFMTSLKGGFAPIKDLPVNFVKLTYMKINTTNHYDHEQMELVNFMPWHKNNKLMKGSALQRITTPHAENEPDYLTSNFFEKMEAIYRIMMELLNFQNNKK